MDDGNIVGRMLTEKMSDGSGDDEEEDILVHREVRRWDFLDVLFDETWNIAGRQFQYFYLTPGRKLVFVDEDADDETRGCYMQIYRFDYEGMQELCEETDMVRVSIEDFRRFAAEIDDRRLREYAEKHHMPTRGKRIRVFAIRWRDIYRETAERHGTRRFEFFGYSRHKVLTTGSVWGKWSE